MTASARDKREARLSLFCVVLAFWEHGITLLVVELSVILAAPCWGRFLSLLPRILADVLDNALDP